jgi:hypothetical protein
VARLGGGVFHVNTDVTPQHPRNQNRNLQNNGCFIIRWIKLALAGAGVQIEVLAQTRQDSRGRMKRRRSLIVLDNRYVVVLEPSEEDGFAFVFITAFPADQSYLDRIRRGATVLERRARA